MEVVVDCHLHLYPQHDEGLLFEFALRNMGNRVPGAMRAAILAERTDCDRFSDLMQSRNIPAGFEARVVDEISVALRELRTGEELLLVAGTQIATKERLEVLSICSTTRISDGLSLNSTIDRVRDGGGLAVLTWAPGKWSGARGRQVIDAVTSKACRPLFLCDTTLRPIGWPKPGVFAAARTEKLRILAGTDPLPIPGDELQAGTFGVVLTLPHGRALSGTTLKGQILDEQGEDPRIIGNRNFLHTWLPRYLKYMMKKRSK